ncbi:MAG: RtcB family protein [Elusimicrobia bacterium]|nr:RtcB family protein [Elusimicrobiota bacterium]
MISDKIKCLIPGTDIDNISAYLDEIALLPGVEKVAVFPDVSMKAKYVDAGYKCSVPSGVAIRSTDDLLYPQLRSRGIGCGMIAFRTGLEATQENIHRFKVIFKKIFKQDFLASRLYKKLNPGGWRKGRYGIRRDEWEKAYSGGIGSYLRMHLEEKDAQTVEGSFEADGNHAGGALKFKEFYSDVWKNGAKYNSNGFIGNTFGGNHFLELQEVQGPGMNNKSLKAGELAVMAHLCGNRLEFMLRKDMADEYILRDYYRPIRANEKMYDVIKEAVGLLKNLGSLRRACLYMRLRNAVKEVFGEDISGNFLPVAEGTHNDIDFGHEDGKIIYRHNVVKYYRNRWSIISGMNDHPSYLVLPGESSAESLDSAEHGLGKYLEGKKEDDRGRFTEIFVHEIKMFGGFKTLTVPHYTRHDGDRVIDFYIGKKIIKDSVKLLPLVSFNRRWNR